ncbi:hypothetical protein ACFFWC_08370 [Plantactinospora siamensis]|uniref:Ig-like domain-containing protein n=1 Tax=Plantactinospora siamensis TaxID=555372 RepID=A0ABV6P3Y2_9ACTN
MRRTGTGRWWAACRAVAGASLLALTSCAPATTPSTTAPRPAGAGASAQAGDPAGAAGSGPDCTRATKATIVQTASAEGHRYAFSPPSLRIQRGGFLAITNRSDEVHALTTTPDAGIVSSVLDRKERQVIQFPRSGTFTVRSADATHRATLRVAVAGESGCGAPKPRVTITDGYAFTPKTLSIRAAENFAVVNESGTAHTVTCTPDPGGNRDNSRLDRGETQLLAIDEPGRYVCGSVQHSRARVTITVDGG